MIKKLTPIGNSLGLIIDKPILELYQLDRDTEFEFTADGTGGFRIQPIRPGHSMATGPRHGSDPEMDRILKEMDERYGRMLKNLA